MRTRTAVGLTTLLATTALLAPGGAIAASPVTVSGSFHGDIVYVGCAGGSHQTTGDWSVTLHGTSAKASFDILVDGAPHVTYTFPGMKQAPNSTADHFVVYGRTAAGLLTFTVNDDTASYTIAPYSFGGLTCDSVTYPGTVD